MFLCLLSCLIHCIIVHYIPGKLFLEFCLVFFLYGFIISIYHRITIRYMGFFLFFFFQSELLTHCRSSRNCSLILAFVFYVTKCWSLSNDSIINSSWCKSPYSSYDLIRCACYSCAYEVTIEPYYLYMSSSICLENCNLSNKNLVEM